MESQQYSFTEFLQMHIPIQIKVWALGDPDSFTLIKGWVESIYENLMDLKLRVTDIPKLMIIKPGSSKVTLTFLDSQLELPDIDTLVVRYDAAESHVLWVEVTPEFLSCFLDRRRFVRIAVKFPVKITFPDDPDAEAIEAESVNLGGGGIRIVSAYVFKPGERLKIEFQPDATSSPFKLDALVVMCRSLPFKMGQQVFDNVTMIQFINLTQGLEDRLVGICFRKELTAKQHLKLD